MSARARASISMQRGPLGQPTYRIARLSGARSCRACWSGETPLNRTAAWHQVAISLLGGTGLLPSVRTCPQSRAATRSVSALRPISHPSAAPWGNEKAFSSFTTATDRTSWQLLGMTCEADRPSAAAACRC